MECESADAVGEEFGLHRLQEVMMESRGELPQETADRIVDRVKRWSPHQEDDLTVVVCDYKRSNAR